MCKKVRAINPQHEAIIEAADKAELNRLSFSSAVKEYQYANDKFKVKSDATEENQNQQRWADGTCFATKDQHGQDLLEQVAKIGLDFKPPPASLLKALVEENMTDQEIDQEEQLLKQWEDFF